MPKRFANSFGVPVFSCSIRVFSSSMVDGFVNIYKLFLRYPFANVTNAPKLLGFGASGLG